jgi:curli biogenesis system outer membrane secretion channel CsgG
MRLSIPRLAALGALAAAAACAPAGGVRLTPAARAEAEAAARQAVAQEQRIAVDSLPTRTVGVAPFRVALADTSLAALGYGLADLLMTDLARSGRVEVVDRLNMDALLRELRLVEAGRVDSSTAPRVGRLVGARRLVVGSLTEAPQSRIGLGAAVTDVPTGQLRPAGTAAVQLTDILRAEKQLAFSVFDALGVTLTPAERRTIEELATQNMAALLAYSRGVRYEVGGSYDQAAAQYAIATREDPSFDRARERLEALRGGLATMLGAANRASSGNRAADAAIGRLTAGSALLGTATDPAFPAGGTRLIIVITTPP